MKQSLLLVILLSAIIFTGCQTKIVQQWRKNAYLRDYSEFVTKVEQEYQAFQPEDWNEVDMKFQEFSNQKYAQYEHILTQQERSETHQLRGKYKGIKAKYFSNQALEKLQNAVDQGAGFVKELLE